MDVATLIRALLLEDPSAEVYGRFDAGAAYGSIDDVDHEDPASDIENPGVYLEIGGW